MLPHTIDTRRVRSGNNPKAPETAGKQCWLQGLLLILRKNRSIRFTATLPNNPPSLSAAKHVTFEGDIQTFAFLQKKRGYIICGWILLHNINRREHEAEGMNL